MRTWMASNKLYLNDSTTGFRTISAPWRREAVDVSSAIVESSEVACVPSAKNLDILMDQYVRIDDHIQRICQAAKVQLTNIAGIRRCLTLEAAETLIHAFVISNLCYCNALMCGVSAASMQKLLHIQNLHGCHISDRYS